MADKDKPNKPPKKDKPKRKPIYRRATRDVNVAYQPYLDELARQEAQTQREYGQYGNQIAALYDALGGQLAGLQSSYAPQAQAIQQSYLGGLGGLNALMGSPSSSESQMASGAFGGLGTGGLDLLASASSRNLGYGTSAQRQGAIDSTNYQANVLQNLQDALSDIANERTDLTSRMPDEILSHLAELRDARKSYSLAEREQAMREAALAAQTGSDQAFSDYLMAQAADAANKPGRNTQNQQNQQTTANNTPSETNAYNPPTSSALERFVSGETRWADLAKPKRKRVRAKIAGYAPAGTALGVSTGQFSSMTPQEIIAQLRNLYRPNSRPHYGVR